MWQCQIKYQIEDYDTSGFPLKNASRAVHAHHRPQPPPASSDAA